MIRDKTGKYATWTIGSYPEISLKRARDRALQIRHDLKINGETKPSAPAVARIEKITLRQLLDEVQKVFAKTKKSWRPRGGPKSSAYARNAIDLVFASLLDKPIESLTADDFARVANAYFPVRPIGGKETANGQVSRAITFRTVFRDTPNSRQISLIGLPS